MNTYINMCPVCDNLELKDSDIHLNEGNLSLCNNCSQLISKCSETKYFESMKVFNKPQGTLADNAKTLKRAYRVHSKRLFKLKSFIDKKIEDIILLDVGCSSGSFLNSSKKYGFKNITGVEPASQAAQTAIDSGLDVKVGFLEDFKLPNNSYDIITLFEVIEHLKDPKNLLRECHRILNDKGIFLISTGNSNSWTVDFMKENWDYFDINQNSGHISFYNIRSFEEIAKQTGFEIVLFSTNNLSFYKRGDVSKIKYRIFKILSEIIKPICVKANKGHDILVFLRKKSK